MNTARIPKTVIIKGRLIHPQCLQTWNGVTDTTRCIYHWRQGRCQLDDLVLVWRWKRRYLDRIPQKVKNTKSWLRTVHKAVKRSQLKQRRMKLSGKDRSSVKGLSPQPTCDAQPEVLSQSTLDYSTEEVFAVSEVSTADRIVGKSWHRDTGVVSYLVRKLGNGAAHDQWIEYDALGLARGLVKEFEDKWPPSTICKLSHMRWSTSGPSVEIITSEGKRLRLTCKQNFENETREYTESEVDL
jgi:hypothetical protein